LDLYNDNIKNLILLFLANNIAFVCYRKPNEQDILINIFSENDISEMNDYNEINKFSGFIFHPFEIKKEQPALLLSPSLSFTINTIPLNIESKIKQYSFKTQKSNSNRFITSATSKDNYFTQIISMLSALRNKELKKVILSRPIIKEDISAEKIGLLFNNLEKKYSSAFVYFFHIPNKNSWIGATPELFFKKESGFCKTTALAATQVNTNQNEIIWGSKEKEEQAIVSNYIEDLLVSNRIDNYKKTGPKTISAGNLFHLQTEFSFASSSIKNIGQFLQQLHPTPAVCGLPKHDAISLINKTESYQREYYGGFLGEINNNKTHLFVNLRCMQFIGNKAVLYVGGGITSDSIPEKEWEETCSKAQTLLSVMEKN